MTQGIILYLRGNGELPDGLKSGIHYQLPDGLKPGIHYQGMCLPNGPVEVVISQHGVLELEEAWNYLSYLGCEPIDLLITRAERDRLCPLYPLVRLTGSQVMEGLLGACSQRRGVY